MPRTRRTGASVAVLIAAGAFALAGCASSSGTHETHPATASAEVVAPVIVDLNDVDGTTVEVKVGNVIDLTGDDETYADWGAEIEDESIVSFTPGRDDGSAQFNPGLNALAVGETEVALDNTSTDQTVTFTVKVVDND
ncbi:hypothetical protein [Agromyces silvae]|uniref:hypothetical protein n=1 Tax=Agromyces silvae TaxID=3388266 RepID=UPI00280B5457|nr:hypothetical protein [Agromyces protaetiae]